MIRKDFKRLTITRSRIVLEFWGKVRARHPVRTGRFPLYPWPMQFEPRFVFAIPYRRWFEERATRERGSVTVGRPLRDVLRTRGAVRSAIARGTAFRRATSAVSVGVRTAAPIGGRGAVRRAMRGSREAARGVHDATRSPTRVSTLDDVRAKRVRGSFAVHTSLALGERRMVTSKEGSLRRKRGPVLTETGTRRPAQAAQRGLALVGRPQSGKVSASAVRRKFVAIVLRRSRISASRLAASADRSSRRVATPPRQAHKSRAPGRAYRLLGELEPSNARSPRTARERARKVVRASAVSRAMCVVDAQASRARSATFNLRSKTTWPLRGQRALRLANERARQIMQGGASGARRRSIPAAPRPTRIGSDIIRLARRPRIELAVPRVLRQRALASDPNESRAFAARQVHVVRDSPRAPISNDTRQPEASANEEAHLTAARRVLLPLLQEMLWSERTTGQLTNGVMGEIGRRNSAEQYRKTGGR